MSKTKTYWLIVPKWRKNYEKTPLLMLKTQTVRTNVILSKAIVFVKTLIKTRGNQFWKPCWRFLARITNSDNNMSIYKHEIFFMSYLWAENSVSMNEPTSFRQVCILFAETKKNYDTLCDFFWNHFFAKIFLCRCWMQFQQPSWKGNVKIPNICTHMLLITFKGIFPKEHMSP